MYKQKKIFLLILMVIMTLFLSNIIWAEERTIFFEKGDALYRRGKIPGGSWWFGHCGLYYEWIDLNEDGEPNNPDDFATHRVIESVGGQGVHGCAPEDIFTFTQFDCTKFWGVYTNSDLTAAQRQLIIDTAKMQKDCEYAFFRGYKNPSHYDKHGNRIPGSFRCDGLVEYCYEIAFNEPWKPKHNGGLVPNDTWRRLKPTKQMESERLTKRTEAEVKEVRLEFSPPGILRTYASDEDKGSGITMVEFWDGMPDDTPDDAPGVRLGYDDHDVTYSEPEENHIYQVYGTTANLYAKAFDQAGNTKVTTRPPKYGFLTKWGTICERIYEYDGDYITDWYPAEPVWEFPHGPEYATEQGSTDYFLCPNQWQNLVIMGWDCLADDWAEPENRFQFLWAHSVIRRAIWSFSTVQYRREDYDHFLLQGYLTARSDPYCFGCHYPVYPAGIVTIYRTDTTKGWNYVWDNDSDIMFSLEAPTDTTYYSIEIPIELINFDGTTDFVLKINDESGEGWPEGLDFPDPQEGESPITLRCLDQQPYCNDVTCLENRHPPWQLIGIKKINSE